MDHLLQSWMTPGCPSISFLHPYLLLYLQELLVPGIKHPQWMVQHQHLALGGFMVGQTQPHQQRLDPGHLLPAQSKNYLMESKPN